jgi:hypothetical protein
VPTYEVEARFVRDLRGLTRAQREAFLRAKDELVTGLREKPPRFEPPLRVKRSRDTPECGSSPGRAMDGRRSSTGPRSDRASRT